MAGLYCSFLWDVSVAVCLEIHAGLSRDTAGYFSSRRVPQAAQLKRIAPCVWKLNFTLLQMVQSRRTPFPITVTVPLELVITAERTNENLLLTMAVQYTLILQPVIVVSTVYPVPISGFSEIWVQGKDSNASNSRYTMHSYFSMTWE